MNADQGRILPLAVGITGGVMVVWGVALAVGALMVGPDVDERRAAPYVAGLAVGYVVFFVAWLVTGIAWMVWQYRVTKSLRAIAAPGVSIAPTLGALSWLIPYANWVLPFIAVQQIDRAVWPANHPDQPHDGWTVGWWWALFVSGDVVPLIAGSLVQPAFAPDAPAPDEPFLFVRVMLVAFGVGLVLRGLSAVPSVALVRRIRAGLATMGARSVPTRPDVAGVTVMPPPPWEIGWR